MKISVLNDEIDMDIKKVLEIIVRESLFNVELRKIDDKYLYQFPIKKLKEINQDICKNKVNVTLIDSPIGKNKNMELPEEKVYLKYIEICKLFNCNYLRVFTDLGKDVEAILKYYSTIAKQNGIVLLIENEKNTKGEKFEYIYDLLLRCNENVKVLFDIENYYASGQDCKIAWEKLSKHIEYVHLRDYSKSKMEYVDIFDGDINLHWILENTNDNVCVSLETHMAMNGKKINKEKTFVENLRRIKKYDI